MKDIAASFDSIEPFANTFGRSGRYIYAKATRGNELFFVKQALNQKEQNNLLRELIWSDFFTKVTQGYPDMQFRALRHVELMRSDTLVTDWIEAPFLAEPNDGALWTANLDRYIRMLTIFDEVAEAYHVPNGMNLPPDRNFTEVLNFWLRNVAEDTVVTLAKVYIADHSSLIQKRMQHGDLTPWQVFNRNGVWTVIDGERSGIDLPRFNDLAYGYGRLAIRCNDPKSAEQLLRGFIEQRNISTNVVENHIRPVLVLRLLGMLGDAANDKDPGKYAIARQMVEYCINTRSMI